MTHLSHIYNQEITNDSFLTAPSAHANNATSKRRTVIYYSMPAEIGVVGNRLNRFLFRLVSSNGLANANESQLHRSNHSKLRINFRCKSDAGDLSKAVALVCFLNVFGRLIKSKVLCAMSQRLRANSQSYRPLRNVCNRNVYRSHRSNVN